MTPYRRAGCDYSRDSLPAPSGYAVRIAGSGRLLRTLASPIRLFCIFLLTSSIAETISVVDSGFMVD